MLQVPLRNAEKLALTTPGHLEVFFLGTGGAFYPSLGNTNFLLIKGKDHLLVDFGITGPSRLWEKARLKPHEIDNIFLTHAHADHAGGVEQLAFMNRFIAKKKPTLWAPEQFLHGLWENTLSGGMKYLTGCDHPLRLGDYFTVKMPRQLDVWPNEHYWFQQGEIKVKVFVTEHITAPLGEPGFISYGICVNDRVFFSGDSMLDMDRVHDHYHCDALFHDCSVNPGGNTHAELDELRMIRSDVKKKTFLVHYSDDYRDHDIEGFAGWGQSGVRYIFANN